MVRVSGGVYMYAGNDRWAVWIYILDNSMGRKRNVREWVVNERRSMKDEGEI